MVVFPEALKPVNHTVMPMASVLFDVSILQSGQVIDYTFRRAFRMGLPSARNLPEQRVALRKAVPSCVDAVCQDPGAGTL
jgi:hypothetical protein